MSAVCPAGSSLLQARKSIGTCAPLSIHGGRCPQPAAWKAPRLGVYHRGSKCAADVTRGGVLKVGEAVWQRCLARLELDVPAQQFNAFIRPLHVTENATTLCLLAPNSFVLDWVRNKYLPQISALVNEYSGGVLDVSFAVGSGTALRTEARKNAQPVPRQSTGQGKEPRGTSGLKSDYTFATFVEGKSNQLARAACLQIAENPGTGFNPLFLYGGVGLGKTHLMHAVGNLLAQRNPQARVVYLHSERFVGDMVKALQHNAIGEFKRFYRSVDALLIDDIQFFAGKERSQEEFFHTFNALLEAQQQIVLSCDRYPKEVAELDERLKSRFGWGLTVAIEPPELETRVAILMSKALRARVDLPDDVAFFVAKRFRSNIRELEGALHRVVANSHFTGRPITLDFCKEALRDLLALQEKLVTVENIQKTVAEFYKMRISDLTSKRRNRSVARPRQIAMALAKELTTHSLPEIGDAFGGRDHTTVLHACRKVSELRKSEVRIAEDYSTLSRILSS